MDTNERVQWLLRHEPLWNDRPALLEKMYEDGVYSRKLSNVNHCVDCLLHEVKQIKKRSANPSAPLVPRTSLRVTRENFDELIKEREVIDILSQIKHPFRKLDESGFTYYDYAVFKRNERRRLASIIEEMNIIFAGGDVDYYN
jgi:hypothetical protein